MKKNLILLHGAIGASKQLRKLGELLESDYKVFYLDFDGHGGKAITPDFGINLFSQNLIDFVKEKELSTFSIFGYSMGGYVTLNAIANGLRVDKLVTLGTKFSWTPEGAAKEIKMLNPSLIEEKIPQFALYQNDLHAPTDWKEVMLSTARMMTILGNAPLLKDEVLQSINTPTLCLLGDSDTMVTKEETQHVVALLSNGEFEILPDCQHPIEKVPLNYLYKKIKEYL